MSSTERLLFLTVFSVVVSKIFLLKISIIPIALCTGALWKLNIASTGYVKITTTQNCMTHFVKILHNNMTFSWYHGCCYDNFLCFDKFDDAVMKCFGKDLQLSEATLQRRLIWRLYFLTWKGVWGQTYRHSNFQKWLEFWKSAGYLSQFDWVRLYFDYTICVWLIELYLNLLVSRKREAMKT